jgi:hypothetical protein
MWQLGFRTVAGIVVMFLAMDIIGFALSIVSTRFFLPATNLGRNYLATDEHIDSKIVKPLVGLVAIALIVAMWFGLEVNTDDISTYFETIVPFISVYLVTLVAVVVGIDYWYQRKSGVLRIRDKVELSSTELFRYLLARSFAVTVMFIEIFVVLVVLTHFMIPSVIQGFKSTLAQIHQMSSDFAYQADLAGMPEPIIRAILKEVEVFLADWATFLIELPLRVNAALSQMVLAAWISVSIIFLGVVVVPFAHLEVRRPGLAIASVLTLLIGFEMFMQFILPANYRPINYGPSGVSIGIVVGFTFAYVVGQLVERRFKRRVVNRICWQCGKSVGNDASYCDSCKYPLAVGLETVPEYLGYTRSKVLHVPRCRFLKVVNGGQLEGFRAIDKAISIGYKRCRVCFRGKE